MPGRAKWSEKGAEFFKDSGRLSINWRRNGKTILADQIRTDRVFDRRFEERQVDAVGGSEKLPGSQLHDERDESRRRSTLLPLQRRAASRCGDSRSRRSRRTGPDTV